MLPAFGVSLDLNNTTFNFRDEVFNISHSPLIFNSTLLLDVVKVRASEQLMHPLVFLKIVPMLEREKENSQDIVIEEVNSKDGTTESLSIHFKNLPIKVEGKFTAK